MPKNTSQKKQLYILGSLILAFACMIAYSFKDRIDIPTETTLIRLRQRLRDRQLELQQATAEANEYQNNLQEARRKLQRLKYNPALEREAIAKMDRILDDSNVTKSRSNINSSHGRGKTNLQQVNINLDFEDVTMRKLTDLFETFGLKSMGAKTPLYWTRLSITPRTIRRRNPRLGRERMPNEKQYVTTRQLNVSATVSSYTLFPTASELVFTDLKTPDATQGTKRKGGRK